MDHLVEQKASFAFETTLSARNYLNRIRRWKESGYDVQLVFLSLPTAMFAINRVKQRVKQGGHNIPEAVIRRRFARGLRNLGDYKKLVNAWQIYDNSASVTVLVEEGKNEDKEG
jgi:predicted ABC-type ATPase